MWEKLYIRFNSGDVLERYVYCRDTYDLYAVIGYIYSTSINKIDRISDEIVSKDKVEEDKVFSLKGRVWDESKYTLL